jgi:hypothetical protein
MTQYIVTIRILATSGHDPHNKKTGTCLVSDNCTDQTGAHHSFLTSGTSCQEVQERYQHQFHVTRVEAV